MAKIENYTSEDGTEYIFDGDTWYRKRFIGWRQCNSPLPKPNSVSRRMFIKFLFALTCAGIAETSGRAIFDSSISGFIFRMLSNPQPLQIETMSPLPSLTAPPIFTPTHPVELTISSNISYPSTWLDLATKARVVYNIQGTSEQSGGIRTNYPNGIMIHHDGQPGCDNPHYSKTFAEWRNGQYPPYNLLIMESDGRYDIGYATDPGIGSGHIKSHLNPNSYLSICVVGNWQNCYRQATESFLEAIREIMEYAHIHYGTPQRIFLHKNVDNTQCPGDIIESAIKHNFPHNYLDS